LKFDRRLKFTGGSVFGSAQQHRTCIQQPPFDDARRRFFITAMIARWIRAAAPPPARQQARVSSDTPDLGAIPEPLAAE